MGAPFKIWPGNPPLPGNKPLGLILPISYTSFLYQFLLSIPTAPSLNWPSHFPQDCCTSHCSSCPHLSLLTLQRVLSETQACTCNPLLKIFQWFPWHLKPCLIYPFSFISHPLFSTTHRNTHEQVVTLYNGEIRYGLLPAYAENSWRAGALLVSFFRPSTVLTTGECKGNVISFCRYDFQSTNLDVQWNQFIFNWSLIHAFIPPEGRNQNAVCKISKVHTPISGVTSILGQGMLLHGAWRCRKGSLVLDASLSSSVYPLRCSHSQLVFSTRNHQCFPHPDHHPPPGLWPNLISYGILEESCHFSWILTNLPSEYTLSPCHRKP